MVEIMIPLTAQPAERCYYCDKELHPYEARAVYKNPSGKVCVCLDCFKVDLDLIKMTERCNND